MALSETDELLIGWRAVGPDHRHVEHIERSEQRRGAVALVVVCVQGAARPFFIASRLGAVERLYLALLVDRESRWRAPRIDVSRPRLALVRRISSFDSLRLPPAMR